MAAVKPSNIRKRIIHHVPGRSAWRHGRSPAPLYQPITTRKSACRFAGGAIQCGEPARLVCTLECGTERYAGEILRI